MRIGRVSLLLGIFLPVLTVSKASGDTNRWQIGPEMRFGRSEIAAAAVGHKIYVAGGIGFFSVLRSCEVLDTRNKRWQSCPDLPRRLHHVAMASDGRAVYAAGGYTTLRFTHDQQPSLWRLSPGAPAWERISSLPHALGEHSMVHTRGKLFLIGGRTPKGITAAVWAFDLKKGTWKQHAPMPTPRHSTAVAIVRGKIWVLGGRNSAQGSRVAAVEVFDPRRNSWRKGPALPVGRGGHTAIGWGSKIHVFNGEVFGPSKVLHRHDILDTRSGRWSTGQRSQFARHGSAAVVVGGKGYLIAGGSRPGFMTVYSTTGTTQLLTLKVNPDRGKN